MKPSLVLHCCTPLLTYQFIGGGKIVQIGDRERNLTVKQLQQFVIGAFAASLLAITFALLAHADDFTCEGNVGNITVENLVVPDNQSCQLNETIVTGNINVETNASLVAKGVDVDGNIQSEGATSVIVEGNSQIDGDIQIKEGGNARVVDTVIDGDLLFDENQGKIEANRNTIGGNLQALNNSGGLTITANTIDGNLQCKENDPAPTVSGNSAASKEDQCAGDDDDGSGDDGDKDNDDSDKDDDGYQDDGICDDDDGDGNDDACEEHEIDVDTEDGGLLTADNDDVEIRFPTNAVTINTRFRWTETELDDEALAIAPGQFGQLTFVLKALNGTEIDDDFVFSEPIQMTIRYTDAELGSIDEDDLMLYYRDITQNAWRPVTETCDDDEDDLVLRDTTNNQLTVAVCHLTQFGLFQQLSMNLYLPLVQR